MSQHRPQHVNAHRCPDPNSPDEPFPSAVLGGLSKGGPGEFPIEVPERPPPPSPRVLSYASEQVIGRQLLVFGVPVGAWLLLFVALLPMMFSSCGGVFSSLIFLVPAGFGGYHLHCFLRRFAIHPPCPYCGKTLSSDLSWVCGYCDNVHLAPTFFSVFLRCKRCGNRPRAYKCHHSECGHIVYFDSAHESTHCAYSVGQTTPNVRREEEYREEWELQEKARQHAVRLAELETQYYEQAKKLNESWKQLERSKNPPEPVDPVQIEIQRMLQKLNSRAAKEDALERWRDDRRAEIKAKKMIAADESQKLKDLDNQVKVARSSL